MRRKGCSILKPQAFVPWEVGATIGVDAQELIPAVRQPAVRKLAAGTLTAVEAQVP